MKEPHDESRQAPEHGTVFSTTPPGPKSLTELTEMKTLTPVSAFALGIAALGVMLLNAQPNSATAVQPQRSTLEEVPGFRFVDWRLDDEAFTTEERAREILISECMADKGWEYLPSPAVTIGPNDPLPLEVQANPNDARALELNELDRAAYYLDLVGSPDPNSLTDPGSGGCLAAALEEIPGVYALAAELLSETESLRHAIQSHPQVLSAETQWSECMRSRGFDYSNPDGEMSDEARSTSFTHCEAELREATETARIEMENEFAAAHRAELEAHATRAADDLARAHEIIRAWEGTI